MSKHLSLSPSRSVNGVVLMIIFSSCHSKTDAIEDAQTTAGGTTWVILHITFGHLFITVLKNVPFRE